LNILPILVIHILKVVSNALLVGKSKPKEMIQNPFCLNYASCLVEEGLLKVVS